MLQIRYKTENRQFDRNVRNHREPEELDAQERLPYWISDVLNEEYLENRSKKQSALLGLLIADLLARNPEQLDDVLAILEPDGHDFELVQET